MSEWLARSGETHSVAGPDCKALVFSTSTRQGERTENR
jgi:hypothetical protein